MEKLLLFQIGNRQFGMKLPLIRSIYKTDAFFDKRREKREAGEGGSDPFREMLFIDGKEIPLYDLSFLFSESSLTSDSDGKRVMLTDAGGELIAIKVDRVAQVVSVASDRIEPLPPICGKHSFLCFPRVLKQADTLILLLDPEGIGKIREKEALAESPVSEADQEERIQEASDMLSDSDEEDSKISVVPEKEETSSPSEKFTASDDLKLIHTAIRKGIRAIGKKAEEIMPEEMEALLTRIVQEEIIADIIIRHLKKIIEIAILREIRKMKKALWG